MSATNLLTSVGNAFTPWISMLPLDSMLELLSSLGCMSSYLDVIFSRTGLSAEVQSSGQGSLMSQCSSVGVDKLSSVTSIVALPLVTLTLTRCAL